MAGSRSVLDLILRTRKTGTGAKDAEREMKELSKTSQVTAKGQDLLKGAVMGAGFALANMALEAAKGIPELFSMGIEIGRAETALIAYTGSSAQAELATQKMIEASDDTLTSFEAQQNASKLFAMGLANTGDEAAKLTDIALTLGASMGKGPTEAFEQFSLLLANQSIPRLDTFGISAAFVRGRIDELTNGAEGMTRETAFMTAVMEDAEGKLGDLDAAGFTAGTSVDRLARKFRQAKEDAASFLAEGLLPILDGVEAYGNAGEDLATKIAFASETQEEFFASIMNAHTATLPFATADFYDMAKSQQVLEESLNRSDNALATWTTDLAGAPATIDDVTGAMGELDDKIVTATDHMLSFSQKALAQEAIKQLRELKTAVGDDEEAVALLDAEIVRVGINSGLWTAEQVLADRAADELAATLKEEGVPFAREFANTMLAAGENTGEAKSAIQRLREELAKLDGKVFRYRVIGDRVITSDTGGGLAIGAHSGADFIVPPGFPNDSFPMRVESGEHVKVTPANQVNNNFNMTVNSSAPTEPIIQDFRFFQQRGSLI